MKGCFIFIFFELCYMPLVFSQGALQEFVIEKDVNNNPQVIIYKDKGCTPDVGVIVFYTTISNLKFSMPDTPSRLKNVSAYDKEKNCYVLCIQPTDTKIGGISQYSIAITANGYKPVPAFMVSGIMSGVAQYYKINPTSNFPVPVINNPDSKPKVIIQRFSNETSYAGGIFYDKENDPIGKQAVAIFSTKLASTKKFIILEGFDKDKNREDWQIADYQRLGVDYLIVGKIIEFGRKNESVNKKKYQIVQTSISISFVDPSTWQDVFTEEAKGEAKTDSKGYDATLNDKAISDAISKLVNSVNVLLDKKK